MRLYSKQQGASLIWALTGLLVFTVLAVSASRTSVLKTRIAENDVLLGKAYQGAESALAKGSDKYYLVDTATNGTINTAGHREKTYSQVTTDTITTQTTVEMMSSGPCPPLDEVAMSTELAGEAGGMKCQIFSITGTSKVGNTKAVDTHKAGIIQFIPN